MGAEKLGKDHRLRRERGEEDTQWGPALGNTRLQQRWQMAVGSRLAPGLVEVQGRQPQGAHGPGIMKTVGGPLRGYPHGRKSPHLSSHPGL